jgi:multidrug efflux pump subunit AcrB
LSYFTRHRTLANLLLVVLIVAGLVSMPRMRSQFFPDVVVDNINVVATWQGAGAEDIDEAIVQVLEPALLSIEGATNAKSVSREGRANIVLEFEPSWDMSRAAADVETAIDQISTFPDDAEDPVIRRSTWRDRVTDVIVTGPVDVQQLALYADELVLRLFSVGVTRATISGLAAPETVIELPLVNMVSYDITMRQIAMIVAAEVTADPAGDVEGANARVRTGIAKRSAEDIKNIVLRSNPDGSKLRIGDVAEVRVEGIDRQRAFFVGDNSAISVRIDRSPQGDTIEIQDQVQSTVDELVSTLPDGTQMELVRARAEYISGRLEMLLENALQGLALVLALLFLFLNVRTAFWVAAGIPTALCAAIAVMYLAGITINMISLFALLITLGIVVDDAIVVGEHSDQRARMGLDPVNAAETAAKRMALPVFAATSTTVIAFFGLIAVGGRFGDFLSDIPFTVAAVLAASFFECFLILPHHMAQSLKHGIKDHWYDAPSRFVNIGFDWMRDVLFSRLIALVIKARYVVLSVAVVLLASQVVMVISKEVKWRFFNAPESTSVSGNFAMVSSAQRQDSIAMMQEMQTAVETLAKEYEERYGLSPIDYVVAQIGGNSGRSIAGSDMKTPDQLGAISIELIDPDLRSYSSSAFIGELQDKVRRHPLVETISFRGWNRGPSGDALDIQFYGADSDTLKSAAEDLKTALAGFSAVSAIEDDLSYDKEELILDLTAQGQLLGFNIDGLGRVLRNRLNGLEAATYPVGARSAAIRIELPENELTADFLENMQLRTSAGTYVPLADLVSVEQRAGFSTVRRENGIRRVSVSGDVSEDDPAAANEVMDALKTELLPEIASKRQVEWRLSGMAEQEQAFLNDARIGFILCLTGIYLVLTWVFASWTRPLVIMSVIPFGLIGTIYGHYIWNVPLSMFTVVGLLGMTGIIINDSIVLITTIDEYAKERGLIPSVIAGPADRLRPVMLTTLTTVLGLAPLLYERSSQAQFLKPTVITLVYGLGFGMLLVLLMVPALVVTQHDFKRHLRSFRFAIGGRSRGVTASVRILTLLVLGWFSATMGWAIFSNAMLPLFEDVLPNLSLMLRSLVMFFGGTGCLFLLAYIGSFAATLFGIGRATSRQ